MSIDTAAERDECHFGTLSNIVAGEPSNDRHSILYPLMVSVGVRNELKVQEATTRAIASTPELIATLYTALYEIDALRDERDKLLDRVNLDLTQLEESVKG